MKRIWRKITRYEIYRHYRAHGDTYVLYLECGHEASRKASECTPNLPKRIVCKQCEIGA